MFHQTGVTLFICTSLLLLVMASSNPIDGHDMRRNVDNEFEYDSESIAAALAFLQELERRHGYNARPR